MTIPRMESHAIAHAISMDSSFWHPFSMEATGSYEIDFTGTSIEQDDLLGAPGVFYRDPLFRGGAIHFAAVHAGAVLRLHRMFADWLDRRERTGDPYQTARLGELALGAQEAVLWIERGASIAEEGLYLTADKLAREHMVEYANMTRVAIERLATTAMQRVIYGVGAHGLLQPSCFERILRDLTMYLRQPSPDHTLAEVGQASLRNAKLLMDGVTHGFWRKNSGGFVPPS